MWMREGFAIYFNTLKFDKASRELRYEENLSWLETAKNLAERTPRLDSVLLADVRGQPENFQPVSWALVSFFLNAGNNNEYFRTLAETFMLLSNSRTAAENAQTVADRLLRYPGIDQITQDYNAYINSRRTFAELVGAGESAYKVQDYASAITFFQGAIYQKPTQYAPYYYLGLIAYENHDFTNAELYYSTALAYGADAALVNYALGLNAMTDNRASQALVFFDTAIAADPARYQERITRLIAESHLR